MSSVLPQFDPASRTLKIRLIADNPGYVMRPDMFVNVDLPMSGPAAIIIPMEAVLDSGLKKTVFVDKGNGYFEPRQVETGRSLGERIEITRGLMPGEKIVVSGNFLLDSETRMQQASSTASEKISRDPVCGMNINEANSKAAGYVKEYLGKTYFFCSPECLHEFEKAPDLYSKSGTPLKNPPAAKRETTPAKHTHHDSSAMPKSHDMKTMSHKQEAQEAHNMSMPGSDAPMKSAKGNDMFPPAPGAPSQMMPGPGNGTLPPGAPGTTPVTPMKGGQVFSPAPGSPSQTLPGSGNGIALPGSPGTPNVSQSSPEKTDRMPSRPPRRRGAVQPGGMDMPDPQKVPSMQQQNNKGMITPETKPDLTDQQKNPVAGDKAHD
jgi:YHS domain-containing protein